MDATYIKLTENQLAYVAGIIDSEGSFSLVKGYGKRDNHKVMVRQYVLSVRTTDKMIIPYLVKLLGKSSTGDNYQNTIKINSKRYLQYLIPQILPYLQTKYEQAINVLTAMNIKGSSTLIYTQDEIELWERFYQRNKAINARGQAKIEYGGNPNHKYHHAWFAGLLDGDGSFNSSVFTQSKKNRSAKTYKMCLNIGLTHKYTIDYIGKIHNKETKNVNDKRPTRSKSYRIRFLSNDIIKILPDILPHLVLKKEIAEKMLFVCKTRIDNLGRYNCQEMKDANLIAKEMRKMNGRIINKD